MKRIIFSFTALIVSISVNAQLKVLSNGQTQINQNGSNVTYALTVKGTYNGIKSYKIVNDTTAWGGGVYGHAYSNNAGYPYGIMGEVENYANANNYAFCYGVFGKSSGSKRGMNYGIYGELPSSKYGAGIYGSIYYYDANDPNSHYQGYDLYGSRYAGYFAGPVKVTYGSLEATLVTPLSVPGGMRGILNENEDNHQSMTERLSNLSMVCFEKKEPVLRCGNDSDYVFVRNNNPSTRRQYSLTAEELETFFPEFVYTNENGEKFVSYVDMVPVLIQSINELSQELNKVRCEIKETKVSEISSAPSGIVSGMRENTVVNQASLSQNIPNPWSVTTTINAFVPQAVSKAVLGIYDLTGKEVKEINIMDRGKVSINLKSYDFVPGIYIYTLLNDGNVVETKRMLLTK